MKTEDIKNGVHFLSLFLDSIGDGSISKEEGQYLCKAGKKILEQLLPLSDRRFVVFGLRAGISVLDWLESDLGENNE